MADPFTHSNNRRHKLVIFQQNRSKLSTDDTIEKETLQFLRVKEAREEVLLPNIVLHRTTCLIEIGAELNLSNMECINLHGNVALHASS